MHPNDLIHPNDPSAHIIHSTLSPKLNPKHNTFNPIIPKLRPPDPKPTRSKRSQDAHSFKSKRSQTCPPLSLTPEP